MQFSFHEKLIIKVVVIFEALHEIRTVLILSLKMKGRPLPSSRRKYKYFKFSDNLSKNQQQQGKINC